MSGQASYGCTKSDYIFINLINKMTENLITLDLGGLLNQLNGIEEGVIELKTKVQTHTKSIAASDK